MGMMRLNSNVNSKNHHTSLPRWDSDGGGAGGSNDETEAIARVRRAPLPVLASPQPRTDHPLKEYREKYIGADEAALWDDADLADFMGSTHVERGVYHVVALQNDEGEADGAQLRRRDVAVHRVISLSQDQYAALLDLPFFEKR
jgi:hypothetical protein